MYDSCFIINYKIWKGALLALQDNKESIVYLCKTCISKLFNNEKSAFDSSSDEEN